MSNSRAPKACLLRIAYSGPWPIQAGCLFSRLCATLRDRGEKADVQVPECGDKSEQKDNLEATTTTTTTIATTTTLIERDTHKESNEEITARTRKLWLADTSLDTAATTIMDVTSGGRCTSGIIHVVSDPFESNEPSVQHEYGPRRFTRSLNDRAAVATKETPQDTHGVTEWHVVAQVNRRTIGGRDYRCGEDPNDHDATTSFHVG